ncbi:MAG: hypothetical protein SNH01_01585 [Rikenellaceae bacterium]
MRKQPASQETLDRLYANTGLNFTICTPALCSFIPKLEELLSIDIAQIPDSEEKILIELHQVIARLNSFYNLVLLDLSTSWRASSRSASTLEKRNNLKYFNVITTEGYRYLFGKDRKFALWNKLRALTEQLGDTELMKDVESIKRTSIEFKKEYNKPTDGKSRNFSIHYSDNPIDVYDYLSSIVDEDFEAKRISSFLSILNELSILIIKYKEKYAFDLHSEGDTFNIGIKERLNVFPDKANKMLNQMTSSIPVYGNSLDKIIRLCNMPNKLIENEKFRKLDVSPINKLAETTYPAIQIHFIYLDLACCIKAYLTSEYYLEKQLNLRRMNIILYEGFNNLYGFDEGKRENTFWRKYISCHLNTSDDENACDNNISKIESKLNQMANSSLFNRDVLRGASTHYRYEDKDNLIPLFQFAVNSPPAIELMTAFAMLKVLSEIIGLNKTAMSNAYKVYKEGVDKPKNQFIEKLDLMIESTRNSDSPEEKKQELLDLIFNVRHLVEDPINALKEYRKSK